MFTKRIKQVIFVVIAASGFSFSAQAELIDQYTTTNSEYAQVYANGTSVNLIIEGADLNQTITLSHSNYATGYWRGVIPASALTVTGINSISISVNTCDYTASSSWGSNPCGMVDVNFIKDDFLWKTSGVRQYTWGNTIRQYVGGVVTFSASSTGTVKGLSIESTRAYMGKYTKVAFIVSTAN